MKKLSFRPGRPGKGERKGWLRRKVIAIMNKRSQESHDIKLRHDRRAIADTPTGKVAATMATLTNWQACQAMKHCKGKISKLTQADLDRFAAMPHWKHKGSDHAAA